MMRLDRIHYPVHSLGPGERAVVWVRGCSRSCPGCISPELQSAGGTDTNEAALAECLRLMTSQTPHPRLTISGGEPFEQASALLCFLKAVRPFFEDVLVYTGFTLAQIKAGACGDDGIAALAWIDVLIDGPYIDDLNQSDCVLRGSSNQVIHFFNPGLRQYYLDYMAQGRFLETFSHNDSVYVVGIMDRSPANKSQALK